MVRSGYSPAAITVVYNPAPAARPQVAGAATASAEPPHFLFLGRMVPGKGLQWLLRSVPQVRADARFEIIGTGPEKSRLVEMAQALGVADRLIWSDWLDEEKVFARLARARALIFPSLWQEPAGLVAAEAAAAGRAVIASRVGGIPEYAAMLGHTLLVEPGATTALAAAIDQLAGDVQHAAKLGHTGWSRVTAGTLSLSEHLDELQAVYARVIKDVPF